MTIDRTQYRVVSDSADGVSGAALVGAAEKTDHAARPLRRTELHKTQDRHGTIVWNLDDTKLKFVQIRINFYRMETNNTPDQHTKTVNVKMRDCGG